MQIKRTIMFERKILTTGEAARLLNRKPQTLRKWASVCCKSPPIDPVRINGRLGWKLSDLMALVGHRE